MMLVDYAMPGLNGAETALRACLRLPKLPIAIASGHADTNRLKKRWAKAQRFWPSPSKRWRMRLLAQSAMPIPRRLAFDSVRTGGCRHAHHAVLILDWVRAAHGDERNLGHCSTLNG
jgi:CheY-like chemotaxis protein